MIESIVTMMEQLPVGVKFLIYALLMLACIFVFGLFLTIHFLANNEDPEVAGRNRFQTTMNIVKLGIKGFLALALFFAPATGIVYLLNWPWEAFLPLAIVTGLITFALVYFFFG